MSNSKFKNFIENFLYTITANGLSMILSAILTLFVPKMLNVEDYGYWQLYLFYSSYIGFLHFGWIDGIYLRYGGKEYEKLSFPVFVSQLSLLVLFETFISLCIIFYALFFLRGASTSIIIYIGICSFITIVKAYYLYIFQATNKIKAYAKYTKADKYVFFVGTILALSIGSRNYNTLILMDLLGRAIALILCINEAKEITIGKHVLLREALPETWANISVGIKLMLSNIASSLIIGIIRINIEHHWDIETFGKVSLTMSISSLVMTFINSVAIVMFPMICNVSMDAIKKIYICAETFLLFVLSTGMLFVIPFQAILIKWLPQYKDGLEYLIFLFPMCIYESKMALLINSILKAYRKEKLLLYINLLTVLISSILTILVVYWLNNLFLSIILIVFILWLRCSISEIIIAQLLKINIMKTFILDSILVISFIIIGNNFKIVQAMLLYFLVYILYVFIRKNDLRNSVKYIKSIR